uniref:Uncharacterized protein n=1 Tax=Vombatus ursinus TaxID=29139 RepID=A0A4X2LFA8_VOMUR
MPAATVHHSQRISEPGVYNLAEEKKMSPVVQEYNYVAVNRKFSGAEFRRTAD